MSNNLAKAIESINDFVRGKTFFELYIQGYTQDELLLVGSTDISYYHNLEVRFKNVMFMCCGTGWHVNTDKATMEIMSGHEAFEINAKYGIQQGQTVVRLNNEDDITQWIACESIDVDIKDVRYQS